MARLLFNPSSYDPTNVDDKSRAQLKALVDFFESKGLAELKDEYYSGVWYSDFLDLIAEQGLFASFGTPEAVGKALGGESSDTRWDTARINELNEILGFYSLSHWYAWQVSVLGLGPIWTSANESAKLLTAKLLEQGGIFGFGLSEKTHGADIYSTDVILTREGDGWTASGPKYYIGNGNAAARLSVFGKFSDDDPEFAGEYVFFLVDPSHSAYHLEKNVVHGQMFVAAFNLDKYPVAREDILHTGKPAWDAALASVNVGKVNLGWASIGICEHAFYEAVTHANRRVLYGNKVTDFTHVRRIFGDAYARLIAMKMFSARAADYQRSASEDDRRFLLYSPITKMKVTGEGERVVNLLWDVVAARGFEKDSYFSRAAADIRALPKLEGTVHVNLALVLKFLPAYLGAAVGGAGEYAEIPVRRDASDDEYMFQQGPAAGLSKIAFHDPKPAFQRFAALPNVAAFTKQMGAFGQLIATAAPSKEQSQDLDFLLSLGQLFTQVVYAQLILEAAALALDGAPDGKRQGGVSDLSELTEAHVDRIFAVFVQDFNEYAIALYGQTAATEEQKAKALTLINEPTIDEAGEAAFVAEVLSYDGAYEDAILDR